MTNSIETAWRAAKATVGPHAANRVLVAHGGQSGVFDSIPANRIASCLTALDALADGADDGREKSKPTTVDDIREAAFARFNNPPSMRKHGG